MRRIINLIIMITAFSCWLSVYSQDIRGNEDKEDEVIEDLPQGLNIVDNPFNKVSDDIKHTAQFQRVKWFYEQRMYPYNSIPDELYNKGLLQKEKMLKNGEIYDNPSEWASIMPGGISGLSGVFSGRISSVKYDPVDPRIIYAAGSNGGVWKSTDAGATWIPKSDKEVSLSSGALAIDYTNHNIVYYGTGDADAAGGIISFSGKGILKSTDGGDTWLNYNTGLPAHTYFANLVIRPNHPNELFGALRQDGLYKSTDAGEKWVRVFAGRCDDLTFSPGGDSLYIVGSGTGYRYSFDGGLHFSDPDIIRMGDRNQITLCRDYPNVLYISEYINKSIKLYKSTDGGRSMFPIAKDFYFSFSSQAGYDFYIRVNPHDSADVYMGLIFLWRSTDGGKTWDDLRSPMHSDQQEMDFHPVNPNEAIIANDGGLTKTTDKGANWTNLNTTFSISQFYRMVSDPANTSIIFAGLQDIGICRTKNAADWVNTYTGDGGVTAFNTANDNYVMASIQYGASVLFSTNRGDSWLTLASSGQGAWVCPLVSHPTEEGIFYLGKARILKTTHSGGEWKLAELPGGGLPDGAINQLATCKTSPNIIYATVGSKIYRSVDGAVTFTNITHNLPNRVISSVYCYPDNSNDVLVTFSGYGTGKVFRSNNEGNSWHDISANLPDAPVNDILIYQPTEGQRTNILAVATDLGVFIKKDSTNSWVIMSGGLPNSPVMCFDHNPTLHKTRIATFGRGAWETSFGPEESPDVKKYTDEIPLQYNLYQNYPNPFNPSTEIRFGLLRSSFTKITIYDVSGKVVATPVNQNLDAGSYQVNFNAAGLSSGVYFYRIEVRQAGSSTVSFVQSKKMILLK